MLRKFAFLLVLCPVGWMFGGYGRLPIGFEENRGQTDPRVRYLARSGDTVLFLTRDAAVLRLPGAAFEMKLRGANPKGAIEGFDPLPGVSNYFVGRDPQRWRTGVPRFARVRYREIYPGIDLIFYGNARGLEYDFVVSPSADPGAIRLKPAGADSVELSAEGDLILHVAGEEIRQRRPAVYQQENGIRQEIAGGYRFQKSGEIGFDVSAYDRSRPLVIDPVLTYNTRIGPRPFAGQLAGNERGAAGIAVDAAGNAYVVGSTSTADFPVTPGAFQTSFGKLRNEAVYVFKLNAAGTALVYATFLGGSGDDQGAAIAIDADGNAYITGVTSSPDFPTTAKSFQRDPRSPRNAFVAKLNPAGSALVYSTYLGGSGGAQGRAIAIDAARNAYVTGATAGDFPTTPGAFRASAPAPPGLNAFVTKLSADGSALVYSSYLGPTQTDVFFLPAVPVNAIAVDSAGSAYVAGTTFAGNDFPVTTGAMQVAAQSGLNGFISKFSPDGSSLVYSAIIGGNNRDGITSVAVDASGNAYLAGFTDSPDFPTTPGAFQPNFVPEIPPPPTRFGVFRQYPRYGFLMKLNSNGSAPLYSTLLGGAGNIIVSGVVLDAAGHAFLAGSTDAPNFPVTPDALQPCINDQLSFANAFLTEFDPAGAKLVYSTYLGGNVRDDGAGGALDRAGNAYLAGRSDSTDFSPAPPGAAGEPGGFTFVSKINLATPMPPLTLGCVANAASLAAGAVAPGEIVSLFGNSIGPAQPATMQVNGQGVVDSTLAGVRVLFDGVPAPLLYVSANQINAIVPYEVAPFTHVAVEVEFQGKRSAPVDVAVHPSSLAIFADNAAGIGQAAVVNQDGTLNSPANPAPRGTAMSIFANGPGIGFFGGPKFTDGEIATQAQQLGFFSVTFGFGGATVTAAYAGTSPTQVVALLQVNAFIPQNAPTGGAVPLSLNGQNVTSQRVTIAIQ